MLVLACQGCFATVTGGGYAVETSEGHKPGFGIGLHVGFYLDFDPVRVAFGPGGEPVTAAVGDSREGVGVRDGTVELSYSVMYGRWWRGRATGAYTWGRGYAKTVNGDEVVVCDGECPGKSYFLGGTFDIPLNSGSLSASLGPHLLTVESAEQGYYTAVGGQLRLSVSFFVAGAATIIGAWKYRPPHCIEWEDDDKWSSGRSCSHWSD